jgi:hypothetical protein
VSRDRRTVSVTFLTFGALSGSWAPIVEGDERVVLDEEHAHRCNRG